HPSFDALSTTTSIPALALHDALPIFQNDHIRPLSRHDIGIQGSQSIIGSHSIIAAAADFQIDINIGVLFLKSRDSLADFGRIFQDRKSTRLNSSHVSISYAVFCLQKK